MANLNVITLLKGTFCDFINKILPVVRESSKSLVMQKWNEFKSVLFDHNKSHLDLFLYVSRMDYLSIESPQKIESRLKTDSSEQNGLTNSPKK